jgi:hypothetical protein
LERPPFILTAEETLAIETLKRLGHRWPKSLRLFAASGTLTVMRANAEPTPDAVIEWVEGIPCDGGDF